MNYKSFIRSDYKRRRRGDLLFDAAAARPVRRRRWLLPLAVASVALSALATLLLPATDSTASSPAPPALTAASLVHAPAAGERIRVSLPIPALAAPAAPPAAEDAAPRSRAEPLEHHAVTVSSGDSLYTLFRSLGLPQADLQRALAAGDAAARLRRLMPGQRLEFFVGPAGHVRRMLYHIDETRSLQLEATADGSYRVKEREVELERRTATATGVIRSSLFLAGQRAGLSDRLIMEMVQIFGWDVDFALDIREGDRFTVIYEEFFKQGEKIREGDILAAEFVNQGRSIRALRYDDGERSDYYSPDGRSMRKAFLRTPVKFSRISSLFNLKRKHPILNTIRAHRGVDYAAPTGTPVKATGDGKVLLAGRKGGYGNAIILQHGGRYSTLYGHLSRFARGIHTGGFVKQGQIIGYVGSTGLATGPHLHYEFRVAGVHRNPLTVPLPKADPIPEGQRADFENQTHTLARQLDILSRTNLAIGGE